MTKGREGGTGNPPQGVLNYGRGYFRFGKILVFRMYFVYLWYIVGRGVILCVPSNCIVIPGQRNPKCRGGTASPSGARGLQRRRHLAVHPADLESFLQSEEQGFRYALGLLGKDILINLSGMGALS